MACPLYIRSVYSLLSSMCSIESIVSYCQKYGYKSAGLVDKNVLAGAISFKKACSLARIKPIFGLEFEVKVDERIHSMILYAKDDEGFANLMALSSYICTNENKVINIDILNNYRSHNILCLLSDDMPLTFAIDKELDILETLKQQNRIFGEYVVGLMDHDISINYSRDKRIKELLGKEGIKCLALNRTFYPNRDDFQDYEVLKCIGQHSSLNQTSKELDAGRYIMNQQEYDHLYETDDLLNTDILASKCNVNLNYSTSLPQFINRNNIPSKDYLIMLCKEGLKRRLKGQIKDNYRKRLEYELSVIIQMQLENYFLIVYDFILFAKKKGILVGPGRGSAAGCLVCYCLGITDIDPIKYGLIFERFLNPERVSLPDIDTDFPDNRRDEVLEYVKEKYGYEHVGHIITYGTLKARQVIRDVGRVLEYSNREIDFICKLIPASSNANLDQIYNSVPLFRQKIESEERYRRLFHICRKLEFNPRHESTHAAGIVMSSKPLKEVVPLIKVENDFYSTQYTMEHLEEFGLIKMDFLGLRNLGIISEICNEINKKETINLNNIPLNDLKTFKLLADVNVLGIFQLESSGMQNLIRKMKPTNFEEIAMAIALFRPGPMKNIPMFLENRNNPENIHYIHPDLQDILQETFGVIVYQEQVLNIARKMAGFSYGKADILRKAMSKKKADELEKLHPDFIDGCLKQGYQRQVGEQVYDLIMRFANYGFNKSHSIGYGLLAYQMAYLKANYPLYFYKALLNGTISSQSKTHDYISECINIGHKVLGVDINHSELKYIIEENCLRMPFTICKDLGNLSAEKIVNERKQNGLFKDYVETVCRLLGQGIDRNIIENLIYVGAFDGFSYSRHSMVSSLDNVITYANAYNNEISLINNSDDVPIIEQLKDDNMVLAENEKKILGFYFSFNPIGDVRKKNNINTVSLQDLASKIGYVKGFGLIKRVKSIKTKKNDDMAFIDLIDEKSMISLTIMPKLYNAYSSLLVKGKYILFEGKMEAGSSCLVKNLKVF